MNPPDIIGQRVRIEYQLRDGKPAIPFFGTVIESNATIIVLDHGANPDLIKSYLRPERVISIHVLKGDTHDRPGEAVSTGAHPRLA